MHSKALGNWRRNHCRHLQNFSVGAILSRLGWLWTPTHFLSAEAASGTTYFRKAASPPFWGVDLMEIPTGGGICPQHVKSLLISQELLVTLGSDCHGLSEGKALPSVLPRAAFEGDFHHNWKETATDCRG